MRVLLRWMCASLFLAVSAGSQAQSGDLHWNQNLRGSELAALGFHQPVVVAFIGNDRWDPAIFSSEPLDKLAGMAFFVWVGANMQDQTTPDQIALEKQFNVTRFPTFILLRPVKTGSAGAAGDHYTFRESARCVEADNPGQCATVISTAVYAFTAGQ